MTPPRVCTTDRDELRRWIPRRYRAALHLAAIFGLGLAAIAWLAIARVTAAPPAHLLLVAPLVAGASLLEYAAHRWGMHRRRWWTEPAWRAHAGRHHHFYREDAPSWDRGRDVWLILFSPADVLALAAAVAGPLALVWRLAGPADGALVAATCIAYFVVYEALHLVCHLPAGHRLLRAGPLAALRARHLRHHRLDDTHGNYAVVVPAWDRLFGTAR